MPQVTFSPSWSPAFRAAYVPGWLSLGVALKVLSPRLHISGRQHLPRRGAVILAPNHLSNIDPVLIGYAALRPLCFMAKRELFEIPLLGPIMRFANAFPVERGTPDRAALRESEARLTAGQSLVVFPEGQCSPDGKLQPILPGVALLALKCRVPVIPVGIANSEKIAPYGQIIPRPTTAKIGIHFARPILLEDLYELPSRQARGTFNERLEEALRAALQRAGG